MAHSNKGCIVLINIFSHLSTVVSINITAHCSFIYLFIYLFAQYHNKNVTSVNFHAAVLALTDFVAWFHNVVE